jgi:hypothetical protein
MQTENLEKILIPRLQTNPLVDENNPQSLQTDSPVKLSDLLRL